MARRKKKNRTKKSRRHRARRDPGKLELKRPWAREPEAAESAPPAPPPVDPADGSPAPEVYVGMPRSEWDTGHDMIRTFVLERRPKNPELLTAVLCEALHRVESWGDFISGGWTSMAGFEVAQAWDLPGFQAGRLFQTLERLANWLHDRGDIDDWQHARLRHAIDEARYSHLLRSEPPGPRGLERLIARWELPRVSEWFAATLRHPVERQLAPGALRVLSVNLDMQLGRGRFIPFGALDVDALVQFDTRFRTDYSTEASCALYGIAAAFYRWLDEQGWLDPERAAHQASKFAAAALGTTVALSA